MVGGGRLAFKVQANGVGCDGTEVVQELDLVVELFVSRARDVLCI